MQEFVIPSMSCGGCVSRITQTIHNLDVSASVEAALKEAGYPPVEIRSFAGSAAAGVGARRSGCCGG